MRILWEDTALILGVKTCDVFFVAQLLLFFSTLFYLACSVCFTSMLSFTGFYTEDNPKILNSTFVYGIVCYVLHSCRFMAMHFHVVVFSFMIECGSEFFVSGSYHAAKSVWKSY